MVEGSVVEEKTLATSVEEAIVLRCEPGDVVIVRVKPDEDDPDYGVQRSEQWLKGLERAFERAGKADQVGVILTADEIEIQVIRPGEGGEPA